MPRAMTQQEKKDRDMFLAAMHGLFPFLSETMLNRQMWPVVRFLPDEERNDFIEAALIAGSVKSRMKA